MISGVVEQGAAGDTPGLAWLEAECDGFMSAPLPVVLSPDHDIVDEIRALEPDVAAGRCAHAPGTCRALCMCLASSRLHVCMHAGLTCSCDTEGRVHATPHEQDSSYHTERVCIVTITALRCGDRHLARPRPMPALQGIHEQASSACVISGLCR